jgi:hypothetical protein
MDINERSEMWESIRERVTAAAQYGADRWRDHLVESTEIDVAQGRYESPIEAIFAAWWNALRVPGMEWADLSAQTEIVVEGTKYRADFTVVMDRHPGHYGSGVFTTYPKLAIELDGHEFHERTKEQATYRNQRDRALQAAGWKVLHVSGSELYRSPAECVNEIQTAVNREWGIFWWRYHRDVAAKKETE